jgi:hypothetical protein
VALVRWLPWGLISVGIFNLGIAAAAATVLREGEFGWIAAGATGVVCVAGGFGLMFDSRRRELLASGS